MASLPGPEASKQPQTITLPPRWLLVWCSFYEMLCWFYAKCNGTHTFQKLLSHQSICPKVLGIIKIFFCFGKCETSLCALFGQQWLLPWNSTMDVVRGGLEQNFRPGNLTLIQAIPYTHNKFWNQTTIFFVWPSSSLHKKVSIPRLGLCKIIKGYLLNFHFPF